MAAQPKKKLSKARSRQRAAARTAHLPNLVVCPHCGNLKISYVVCLACGYYKDRLVFEPKQATKVTRVTENK